MTLPVFDTATGNKVASGTTNTWSHTVATGPSNQILLVAVDCGASVSSVTYGGQALTQLDSVPQPGGETLQLWYRLAPLTGANNVVVTAAGTSFIVGASASYSGAAQSGTFGTVAGSSGTSGASTNTVATANSNQLVIDVINNQFPSVDTATASQTKREQPTSSGLALGDIAATGSNMTLSWSFSSSGWGELSVAMNAATSLSLYVTTTLDATLSNAAKLASVTGASGSTTNHTVIGTNSGWGELGFGGNPPWASGASPGTGDGYGAIWDVTTLEGQTIAAGTWSLKTNVKTAVGTETGALELLVYTYNAGVYTQIGTATLASDTYTTTGTAVTISGSLGAVSFASGDKLYVELWFDSTAHTGTPTNMLVSTSNSATLGFAGAGELDTPGYSPTTGVALSVTMAGTGTLTGTLSLAGALSVEFDGTGTLSGALAFPTALSVEFDGTGTLSGALAFPTALSVTMAGAGTLTGTLTFPSSNLILYGNTTLSGTLPSADTLVANTTGGSASSKTALIGTATGIGELGGETITSAWPALGSLPAPTGLGWLYDSTTLEGNTIAAGSWTCKTHLKVSAGSIVATIYMRAYKRSSGGVYTPIGVASLPAQTITTSSTLFTMNTGITFPQVSFAVGDKLYVDVWLAVSSNSTGSPSATVTNAAAATSGKGAAGNTEFDTPGFAAAASVSQKPYMVKIGSSSTSPDAFTSQAISDIQKLGATSLFFQVKWSLVDTSGSTAQNSANYNWGAWDSAVSLCNAAGIEIYLAAFTPPPQFIAPGTSLCAIPANMATFCQQIAQRYNGGVNGTIQGIFVGNEDYDTGGSGGQPANLVSVLKAAYPAIKAVNAAIKVIAAAKIQRNIPFYSSWFDTLLNPATGAYTGGVFQADVITFHYHTAIPGPPYSLDPRVTSGNIPSFADAISLIQQKVTAYASSLPAGLAVWADENGLNVNTNPGRDPATVISDDLRWVYTQYELDTARTSMLVERYGIFTLGEFAGYPPPNYRDGESLIQGPGNAPVYGPTFTGMQTYISTHPTWGGSGSTPELSVSLASLHFSAAVGGANPASQTDTLAETAGVATAWTSSISYSSGSGWLALSPTSGTLGASGSTALTISCATGALASGVYTGTITLVATTGGATATITVTFAVGNITTLSMPSSGNLGVNYYHESMGYIGRTNTQISQDLANIGAATKKIKVYHNPLPQNAGGVSRSSSLTIVQNIVTMAKSAGFYVVWVENIDQGQVLTDSTTNLSNPSNYQWKWADYSTQVVSDAASAHSAGADEFVVGNEIIGSGHYYPVDPGTHVATTIYTMANFPGNVSTLVDNCRTNFPGPGLISLQELDTITGFWHSGTSPALIHLDKIYFDVYEKWANYQDKVQLTLAADFAGKAYIGETSSIDVLGRVGFYVPYSENDWSRELMRRYDWARQQSITFYAFTYGDPSPSSNGFGLRKNTGDNQTFHDIWNYFLGTKNITYTQYFNDTFPPNDFTGGTGGTGGALQVDSSHALATATVPVSDYVYRGRIQWQASSGSVRLLARYTDSNNYYAIHIDVGANQAKFIRRQSGAETQLGVTLPWPPNGSFSGSFSGSTFTNFDFEIRVSGSGSSTQVWAAIDTYKMVDMVDTGNAGLNSATMGLLYVSVTAQIADVVCSSLETYNSIGSGGGGGSTALTVYSASAASGTLSTADQLYTLSGSPATTWTYSRVGLALHYGELTAQGTTGAWAGALSLPAPTGKGFFLDGSSLVGQQIVAGAWSGNIRLNCAQGGDSNAQAGALTADIIVRAYKYNTVSLVYTPIVVLTLSGQSLTNAFTTYALPVTNTSSATTFGANDVLYIDRWANVTANANGSSIQDVRTNRLSTDTSGHTGDSNTGIATPGYIAYSAPTALTVYGTDVAASTLITAGLLAPASGGVETNAQTKIGNKTGYGELLALGTNTNNFGGVSIGSPSGKGWLFDVTTLEGQTIQAGNWTAAVTSQAAAATGSAFTTDLYLRAYLYDSVAHTYTLIGTLSVTGQNPGSGVKFTATFSATSLPAQAFTTGQKLYIDVWPDITANGLGTSANMFAYEGSTAGNGVTNDIQIVTPGYLPTGGGPTGIVISPTAMSFVATENRSNPPAQTGVLTNEGSSSGTWSSTISYGGSGLSSLSLNWLTLSPISGTLSGNGTQTVSFAVDTSGLGPGTYAATATFTMGTSMVSTAVTLTLSPSIGGSGLLTDLTVFKEQVVKVYAKDGQTFLDVWRDAPLLSGFKEAINSAISSMKVQLPRLWSSFDLPGQPGSRGTVAQGNIVKYFLYGPGLPAGGLCRYQGVIYTYVPTIADNGQESVTVTLLPQSSAFADRGIGGSVSFGTPNVPSTYVDVVAQFNYFFDQLDPVTGDTYLDPLSVDPTSASSSGVQTQYAYINQQINSVFATLLQMLPANWFYRPNPDDGSSGHGTNVTINVPPIVAQHTFIVGQHCNAPSYTVDYMGVKNVVYFQGATPPGGGDPLTSIAVGGSVSTLGEIIDLQSDSRVSDQNTLDVLATGQLNVDDQPAVRATIRVVDYRGDSTGLGYDIETIRVGDSCVVLDYTTPATPGSSLWDVSEWDNAQWDFSSGSILGQVVTIVGATYGFDFVDLELGTFQPSIGTEVLAIQQKLGDFTMV